MKIQDQSIKHLLTSTLLGLMIAALGYASGRLASPFAEIAIVLIFLSTLWLTIHFSRYVWAKKIWRVRPDGGTMFVLFIDLVMVSTGMAYCFVIMRLLLAVRAVNNTFEELENSLGVL